MVSYAYNDTGLDDVRPKVRERGTVENDLP